MKKIEVIIGLSFISLITASTVVHNRNAKEIYERNQTTFNEAITDIENGQYKEAVDKLEILEDQTFRAKSHVMYLYAQIMAAEQNDEGIYTLKGLAEQINNAYNGVMSDEIHEKVEQIQNDYKAEEVRRREEERKEREYREELAKRSPYVGMDESYIDLTVEGEHKGKKLLDTATKYTWYSTDENQAYLTVYCEEGKVTSVIRCNLLTNKCTIDGKYYSDYKKPARYYDSYIPLYHDSYDDGYNDVYEDGDYDWDRYYSDFDYATGVDDAFYDMEELGEDW